MSRDHFEKVIPQICNADTSFSSDSWTNENPLSGHCSVIALLAQDLFGGSFLRASLQDTEFAAMKYHYINVLPNGEQYDFTAQQFGHAYPQNLVFTERTREDLLEHTETSRRYALLKQRFNDMV